MAKIIVEGLQEVQTALKKFVFNMDDALDDAVRVTAIKVMNSATQNIRTPSHSGRFVARGETGQHEVSKEGEAPNTDTGRLIGSIIVDHHKGDQVAFVGTNLDYGAILETTHNRPWLEPAKVKETAFFKNNLAAAMDNQIKKADQ